MLSWFLVMKFTVCIFEKNTGKRKVTLGGFGTTFGEFLQGEGYTPQFGFVYLIEANLRGDRNMTPVQPDDRMPGSVTDVTVESCPKG